MKNTLKLEEWAQFILCYVLTLEIDFPWWYFWAFLLLPDIGMLGYLVNTRIGAFTYNLLHHKGIAILVVAAGWYMISEYVLFAGIILYGHSSFDRIMGYGLKYSDSFQHTHLGWIGKHK